MNFTSDELHDLVEQALDEVQRRLASGELDHSGRYYSDDDLANHVAIRCDVATTRPTGASQAQAESRLKALTR